MRDLTKLPDTLSMNMGIGQRWGGLGPLGGRLSTHHRKGESCYAEDHGDKA